MKQRLGIAAAVMHEPEILVLDEPTSGLNPVGIHEIRKYLLSLSREQGVTIFISSHILCEIEKIADTIGVIHDGKLIEEIDMDSLHEKNRQYIEIQVNDSKRGAVVLEEQLIISDYSIYDDNIIRIYSDFDRVSI